MLQKFTIIRCHPRRRRIRRKVSTFFVICKSHHHHPILTQKFIFFFIPNHFTFELTWMKRTQTEMTDHVKKRNVRKSKVVAWHIRIFLLLLLFRLVHHQLVPIYQFFNPSPRVSGPNTPIHGLLKQTCAHFSIKVLVQSKSEALIRYWQVPIPLGNKTQFPQIWRPIGLERNDVIFLGSIYTSSLLHCPNLTRPVSSGATGSHLALVVITTT
jgi:hypothetical protein